MPLAVEPFGGNAPDTATETWGTYTELIGVVNREQCIDRTTAKDNQALADAHFERYKTHISRWEVLTEIHTCSS